MTACTVERLLNITKEPYAQTQADPVILRKGEYGLTDIVGRLVYNGRPFDSTDYDVTFRAFNTRHEWIVDSAEKNKDAVTYSVKGDLTAEQGDIALAYFELEKDGGNITTDSIPIYISPEVEMPSAEEEKYRNAIDRLMDDLETERLKAVEATGSATAAAAKATSAAESAKTATQNADAATEAANTAKQNADTAAGAARGAAAEASAAASSATAAAATATSAADAAKKTAEDAASSAKGTVDAAMKTFRTIQGATVEFAAGESGTAAPGQGWTSDPMDVAQGAYLWTRTTVSYNQGADTVGYSVAYQGRDGVTQLGNLQIVKDPVDSGLNISWTGEE